MTEADVDALLSLLSTGGATVPRRRLLETHASPAAARDAGPKAWRAAGFDEKQVHAFDAATLDATAHAHSRTWLAQPAHHLIGWHEADYPALLRRISSPPLALFVAGDPALLWHPGIAVVGSRSPTAGGRDNAHDFANALAASGFSVVSGLAAGIDAAAHAGALAAGGLTVAVLGTGIDVPYPRDNTALHALIAASGAVVSEHPPGTQARREHFPSRNRILAGLALGTLVIEAAERSGALITARLSIESGREVFAIPGSIHNPMARGCHRLIRDGAALVDNVQDVIAALAPMAAELDSALRTRLGVPSSSTSGLAQAPGNAATTDDPDYNRLWEALGHDPTGMDRLVDRTGLTTAELSSMLLVMELEGRVAVAHGRYSRKSQDRSRTTLSRQH